MSYLTKEEFKKEAAIRLLELKPMSITDAFDEMVSKLLNVDMWYDYYIVDDGNEKKNKPVENIWIGNRQSGLKFLEYKLNLKTGKITGKLSIAKYDTFSGKMLLDPLMHETVFAPYHVISQVLKTYN